MRSSASLKVRTTLGQACWHFSSNKVRAALMRQGGHLAPVRFHLPQGVVAPFAVAPWGEERTPADLPQVIKALRGDFFCAPFGGNEKVWRGEKHPVHGESANARWRLQSLQKTREETEVRFSLRTKVRAGRIEKILRLRRDETVVYCRHVISGQSGPMSLGHHATLKFPSQDQSGIISTSPILLGQVLPVAFEDSARGGHQSLKPGEYFSRLDRVPRNDGTKADLSRYPARRGFDDLVMVVHQARHDFAWTAVTFPQKNYVWFALKDPRVLRSTILWISNGGRPYAPWNGRHVNVMGLEDVTAYFDRGLAPSAQPNPINRRGFPTVLTLQADVPLTVNYIMGVAAVPPDFKKVKSIVPGKGKVTLISTDGQRTSTLVDVSFLNPKTP